MTNTIVKQTDVNKLANSRENLELAKRIYKHFGEGKSFLCTREGLTDLANRIDLPAISLFMQFGLDDTLTGEPAKLFVINGCKLNIRRSFVPPTEKKANNHIYTPAKKRDEYIDRVSAVFKSFAPNFLFDVERKSYTKDYYDFIIKPRGIEGPVYVILTLPSSIRTKTTDGCAILKKVEHLGEDTRTIVAGVVESIKADTIPVTPFMHEMQKSGNIVIVFDLDTKKPYSVKVDDGDRKISTMTLNMPLVDFKPFNSILDMRFEKMEKINPDTGLPYDLKSKMLKGFK